MSEWMDDLADTFGLEALADAEVDRLLWIAREVAHRVERKETPLATFLLGMHVGTRTAEGTPRDVALDDAIAMIQAMLPAQPDPEQPEPT